MKNIKSLAIKDVEDLSRENNDPSWLKKIRLSAFRKFLDLEQPTFRYGLSTNLDCNFSFDNLNLDNIKNNIKDETIFKSNGIKILNANEIEEKISMKINDLLLKNFDKFDKFDTFTISISTPKFLVIPKNYKSKVPIQIESKSNSDNSEFLIVYCDKESDATIIENNTSGKYLNSKLIYIICEDNSKINFASIQNLSESTYNFTRKIADLKNNSEVNWLDCCTGSLFTNSSTLTNLNGEGSICNTYGMFFGSSSQQFNISASSVHNAPHTKSDMLTRGVLNGYSKAIYHGSIRVESNAFGSDGYQKEDTLLISEDAKTDSIPKLEIENHDVKCTHGATIGQVDSEKLFYLMSRGLSKDQAVSTIVQAFFAPMLNKIFISYIKKELQKTIIMKMNQNQFGEIEDLEIENLTN